MHVPAKERIRVVVLSAAAYRYEAHWVNGRMRICGGAGCDWCARRMGLQARYVLSVMDTEVRCKALLEVGPVTCVAIKEAAEAAGALRGLKFVLRHEGERKAGRLIAEEDGSWLAMELLPIEEDPESVLVRQAEAEAGYGMPLTWEPAGEAPSRNGARVGQAAAVAR